MKIEIKPIDKNRLVEGLKRNRLRLLNENDNDGAAVLDDIIDWIEYEQEIHAVTKNEPLTIEQLRDAWEPCNVCKTQGLPEAWILQRKKFCTYCGRPLTDEAWEELEKRLRG